MQTHQQSHKQLSIIRYAHYIEYCRENDPEFKLWCTLITLLVRRLISPRRKKYLNDKTGNVCDFPEEALNHLLSYMDATSLCHMGATCKHLKGISERDYFWDALLKSNFGIERNSISRPLKSALLIYVSNHKAIKEILRKRSVRLPTAGMLSVPATYFGAIM